MNLLFPHWLGPATAIENGILSLRSPSSNLTFCTVALGLICCILGKKKFPKRKKFPKMGKVPKNEKVPKNVTQSL